MARGVHNSVGLVHSEATCPADIFAEHTLLVTEGGVEVLTARLPDSPGGPASSTPSEATLTQTTNGVAQEVKG